MNATIGIVCYKSKTLSNDEHPLMLKISKDGKRKFQSLGVSVHPEHWDFQKNRPKSSCPNREFIMKLILEKEAEFQRKIIEYTAFQKEYTAESLLNGEERVQPKTVGDFYLELIQGFISQNKRGNARIYNDSLNSLKRFTKRRLGFSSIKLITNGSLDMKNGLKGKTAKKQRLVCCLEHLKVHIIRL